MPLLSAHPAHPDTSIQEPPPGISVSELRLITASARRFLRQTGAATSAETIAAIAAQVIALCEPYTPAVVGDYECSKPNDMHWCTGN